MALVNGYIGNTSTVSGGEKTIVEKGDKVKVYYKISTIGGVVFDKLESGKPLEFTVGSGQMVRGINNAVIGMKLNEEKKVTINKRDAYGNRQESLMMKFDKKPLFKKFEPKIGMVKKIQDMPGTIVGIDEDYIYFDGNHPLAGKDIIFEVVVIGIK